MVFTLPATLSDYPESLQWWTGQIAGVDGDVVKNGVFVLAVLGFVVFTVGPGVWRRPTHAQTAADLLSARQDLELMLKGRWLGAPDKPPDTTERTYFGSRSYEDETISLYVDEHAARITDLLARAQRLGALPVGWGDLPRSVRTVDHVWRLRDRLTPVIKQLLGEYRHPNKLNERVAYLLKVGGDIRSALLLDDAGFGQREYSPYQVFETWRYDLHWLLSHSAPQVWRRFRTESVPRRESTRAELAAYIDLGLVALAEVPDEP